MKSWLHASLIFLVLAASPALRAEVLVNGDGPLSTLVVGIIVEDPEPVGPVGPSWPDAPPSPNLLVTYGGRPDLVFAPGDSAPQVVWADVASIDHDIAFVEWTQGQWSATKYLTTGMAEELDPRIHREADGTLHVVWWRDDITDRVYLSSREPGQNWSDPEPISLPIESARRPSVIAVGDELWVAYERDSTQPGISQELMLARRVAGVWNRQLLVSTPSSWPLDAVLHELNGKIWLDWKQSQVAFGCVEHDGAGWSGLRLEPWSDHSWVGEEQMRKLLQNHVGGN